MRNLAHYDRSHYAISASALSSQLRRLIGLSAPAELPKLNSRLLYDIGANDCRPLRNEEREDLASILSALRRQF